MILSSQSNISSLFSLNALRVNQLLLGLKSAQLSSGNRLVSPRVDPSGLAISQMFRSRIGGVDQAIYNAQDTINLTRTAESTLSTQSEVLGRMRDLAVRASNDATLSSADRDRLNQEFQSLKSELTRSGQAATFNTKPLTTDEAGLTYGTQSAHVGPDQGAGIDVTINPSTAGSMGLATTDISSAGNPQAAITEVDNALSQVASQRANLGITENRLGYVTNDLFSQRINLAEANSRIADTDFALTISEYTRALLMNRIGAAALSHSNASSYGVLGLLRGF